MFVQIRSDQKSSNQHVCLVVVVVNVDDYLDDNFNKSDNHCSQIENDDYHLYKSEAEILFCFFFFNQN